MVILALVPEDAADAVGEAGGGDPGQEASVDFVGALVEFAAGIEVIVRIPLMQIDGCAAIGTIDDADGDAMFLHQIVREDHAPRSDLGEAIVRLSPDPGAHCIAPTTADTAFVLIAEAANP